MGGSPGGNVKKIIDQRATAVVVTSRANLDGWQNAGFSRSAAPENADGGSAAPLTADGYFLTADHVLKNSQGKNVFVLYGGGHQMEFTNARIVWRSTDTDVALLHISRSTPLYFLWTPSNQWLPEGTTLMHGGISTGLRHMVGKLGTSIPPDNRLGKAKKFKLDIPLQPGDSGGPVVDRHGLLVGVNSAIELLVPMETAFFLDAEGVRPNTAMISRIIANDRAQHNPR